MQCRGSNNDDVLFEGPVTEGGLQCRIQCDKGIVLPLLAASELSPYLQDGPLRCVAGTLKVGDALPKLLTMLAEIL